MTRTVLWCAALAIIKMANVILGVCCFIDAPL
jgi:hypothetical protein